MPPTKVSKPATNMAQSLKRKDPPPSSSSNSQSRNRNNHDPKRVKMMDARTILSQKSDAALTNGELDLQAFLKSREFEIKALQDGMERSKNSRTTRAFQQVPRNLRRRTASHNVKRVPKRLHRRAQREMVEDNTPTVDASKRKPSNSRGRIRAETAKRLGILAARKRAQKENQGIDTRPARPKIRRNLLNDPPKPKSKYRKRQIHKTWLPTHMWHTKRAKLTEPKHPLWRFALPLTSSEKSYRPTHRAEGARGCVAWDMSYMSTIALHGQQASVEQVLKSIGVTSSNMWDKRGEKWRQGKRSWAGWLSKEVDSRAIWICPSTIFWCPLEGDAHTHSVEDEASSLSERRLFVRVHPSAFLEVWNEILRQSKSQRPAVHIEDLRYEIGSIEISGPGSTETLLGILHPFSSRNKPQEAHGDFFKSLAGLTNPGSLPVGSLLSFSVFDPRLCYPPRPVLLPSCHDEDAGTKLLENLVSWPIDSTTGSSKIFDREARYKAIMLPSQKALNRRKSLAPPGEYAAPSDKDPAIPIVLLASRYTSGSSPHGKWTLLAPWKCILPIWHGIVHFPLSTGGNPRFGGLDELRQVHFEHNIPWFPADYPGTAAGFAWEQEQRLIKKTEWERRPKGKRVEWDSLDLGAGRKGEVGCGWACDFEFLSKTNVRDVPLDNNDFVKEGSNDAAASGIKDNGAMSLFHMSAQGFEELLSQPSSQFSAMNTVSTIRITIVGRGVANQFARIYRLPSSMKGSIDSELSTKRLTTREEWLSQLSKASNNPKLGGATGQKHDRIPLNVPLSKRIRLMAQSLLQPPPEQRENEQHFVVPDKEDLIGYVTTGAFSLTEGKGVAIGSVIVAKVLEDTSNGEGSVRKTKQGRLCVVRNAGEKVGRLARWEPV